MIAKVKCSNCGAELTNLTFGWGNKQWIWIAFGFAPLIALTVWTALRILPRNHDFTKEIQTSLIDTRFDKDQVDIPGEMKNIGTRTWNLVTVEAEFYAADGKFLDEATAYISASLAPGAEEHFRITLNKPSDQIVKGAPQVVVKVTDAHENRF